MAGVDKALLHVYNQSEKQLVKNFNDISPIMNVSQELLSGRLSGVRKALLHVYNQSETQEVNNSNDRPLLVDVTEELLSGRVSDVHLSSQTSLDSIKNGAHRILWYNKPNWINNLAVNDCLKTCTYRNCDSVSNVTVIRQSSAVIFCLTTNGIGQAPPLNSTERPTDQAWIFFAMESPFHLNRLYKHLRPTWRNSFNWSISYMLDSDIILPYGYLTTRESRPERNYTEIFRAKTKFAALVVSNCHTVSLREQFVKKLKKFGLEIDIYGACGQRLGTDPLQMIDKSYKFYLGFENSLCSDYITEKFFKYYKLNTVVIVRGGADYKRILPHGTYINTADFKSVKGLVNFLKNVGSNETLYTDYLKRKDKYHSIWDITTICPSFCALCRKLNYLNNYRRVYETVPTYSHSCVKPLDIDTGDV